MSVKEDVIYEISRLIRAKKGMLYGSVDTVKGANECRLYIQEAREISDKLANEELEAEKAALSQRVGRSASADYEELKRYWNNYLDALKNGCEGKSLLHNVRVLLGRV